MKALHNKSQIISELFKYLLIGVFAAGILILGYSAINSIKEKGCNTGLAGFELDVKNIGGGLRYGTKELHNYDVPCNVDKIYFFDLAKSINPEEFKDIPIMRDSLKSKSDKNVFLIRKNEVKRSFNAGKLEIENSNYTCFATDSGKLSFFAEGTGKSAIITSAPNQPLC